MEENKIIKHYVKNIALIFLVIIIIIILFFLYLIPLHDKRIITPILSNYSDEIQLAYSKGIIDIVVRINEKGQIPLMVNDTNFKWVAIKDICSNQKGGS